MTNLEAKQEAIKKAYGEYWEEVRRCIDEKGWCSFNLQQEQQKLIAENADTKMERYNDLQDVLVVDKSSIINENNIIR